MAAGLGVLVGDLHQRGALVLGIAGPDPGLGEPELDAPKRLAQAPVQAGNLAASLAAYGYRDVLETCEIPDGGLAAAADVQARIDDALAEPGLIVVHLLTHGLPGSGQGVLYVLGPDGAEVQTSVGEWLNRAEKRRGDCGPVLFVLDVCHAGAAVGYQLNQLVDAERQRAWVLAAASGADPAYDGRLTQALTQVLDRFESGELRVDQSVRYIPLRKLFNEVDRLVRELSLGSTEQEVRSSYVPLHVDVDQLEFFPNPRWAHAIQSNDARVEVATELASMLDEAFDPAHFMRRAGAAEAIFGQVGRGFFHGRAEQLQQLRDWVLGTGPTLQVVTGKPGVGKSALLGVVVCAAHPALREPTRDLWDRLPHVPPQLPESYLAVVHARRRTVAQIIASIARQWQLSAHGLSEDGEGEGEEWTSERLIKAMRRWPTTPDEAGTTRLLVVDAVDENNRPSDLVARVLSPLVVGREDGGPLCRLLVAGRGENHLKPLIAKAEATGDLIDLGAIPGRQLRPSLAAYVKDLLGRGTPYETLRYAPAAEVLAESIACALTAGPGADTDPAPLQWGEFLVAGLYVRHVLDLPPVEALAEARQLGEAVPRDLREVLALDLAWAASGLDAGVVHAAARALAFAEGSGMSELIVGHAATAFLPTSGYPISLDSVETRKALDRLRFYLRRDVDLDGSTLYRLFHQGLADQLRVDVDTTPPAGPTPAVRIWQHLHAMIPTGPDGSRHWHYAEPYLLRHASQHAATAGQLEVLLRDTGFLTYADPAILAPLLTDLPTGVADQAADTYRAGYATHSRQRPAARAQLLAVDAARYGNRELAQRLSSEAIWQPIWASGHGRSAGLRLTLTGHMDEICAVTLGRAGDRDVIISGNAERKVCLWEAVTGQPVGQPLTGHTGPVYAVAIGRAGNRDVIISGSWDRTVWVWDAVTGQPVGPPLTGHTGPVYAVAIGRAGNRDVIASGSSNGSVQLWDAVSGQSVGPPPAGHTGAVLSLVAGHCRNRDVIVSGGSDGSVGLWDAVTGQPVGPPLVGHTGPVYAVTTGRAGNRDVIISGSINRRVRLWDAGTGQYVDEQQFPDGIRSLALADERLVVAQGNDIVVLQINPRIPAITGFSASQESVA